MKSIRRVAAASIVILVCSTPAAPGQTRQTANTLKLERREDRPKAKIVDIAWLQGHWAGTGLGGDVEEVWGPPRGKSMLGMFRLVKDDKMVFCEICTIAEADGSLILKVKHFDANLVGWEDKEASESFPLVKLTPTEACFDGLTYRKAKEGGLVAFVAVHRKSGEVKEEAFHFKREQLTGDRAK